MIWMITAGVLHTVIQIHTVIQAIASCDDASYLKCWLQSFGLQSFGLQSFGLQHFGLQSFGYKVLVNFFVKGLGCKDTGTWHRSVFQVLYHSKLLKQDNQTMACWQKPFHSGKTSNDSITYHFILVFRF